MTKQTKLYLIGSLRNERIPKLAKKLRSQMPDVEVFDDWYSAGPEADDFWKEYEQRRGNTYLDALNGYAARHVFEFDRSHLDTATHALLVLPAGKSGHMEIMYAEYGVGANTAILLDPTDVRWDVMYQFVPTILDNDNKIGEWIEATTAVAREPDTNRGTGSIYEPGSIVTCDRQGVTLEDRVYLGRPVKNQKRSS